MALHILVLHELPLFFKEFVLLKVAGKLVNLLAQSDLLSVALVHQRLLLVYQLILETLLPDGL